MTLLGRGHPCHVTHVALTRCFIGRCAMDRLQSQLNVAKRFSAGPNARRFTKTTSVCVSCCSVPKLLGGTFDRQNRVGCRHSKVKTLGRRIRLCSRFRHPSDVVFRRSSDDLHDVLEGQTRFRAVAPDMVCRTRKMPSDRIASDEIAEIGFDSVLRARSLYNWPISRIAD